MDLGVRQKALKTAGRNFLENECPKALLRELAKDEVGLPTELYTQLAKLGWFGVIVPREYGGRGFNFFDMMVLLEEIGRASLPGPYFATAVLSVLALLWAGSEEQKREFLTPMAQGRTLMTVALTEPTASYETSAIAVTATEEWGAYFVNGIKLFVPQANMVNYVILTARTGDSLDPREDVSLFLVDLKSAGVTVRQLQTITADRQCEVLFDKVRVPRTGLIGDVNKAWSVVERLLGYAAVGLCAQMVGGAQKALEMSVDYAKARVQINRPIGSFQAIQQHCANMAIDVDASRYITYKAAQALSENEPGCETLASIAKAWTSDAFLRVTQVAHRVHGAIAFSDEYDLQFYTKAAVAAAATFGDADFHRERVARTLGVRQP